MNQQVTPDHNTALSIYDLMRELNREYDTAFGCNSMMANCW
ncbi:hypothetical protein O9929_19285 [Vibrio lentus]|nr:hypothetical protein [Vibrio lentus]